jgi:hypothetical protein
MRSKRDGTEDVNNANADVSKTAVESLKNVEKALEN